MRALIAVNLGFLALVACTPDRVVEPKMDPTGALAAINAAFDNGDYQLVDLGSGGQAFDVNDAGAVVGVMISPSGAQHAFFKAPGEPMLDLGTLPGGISSAATAINNRGQVVGRSDLPGGTYHAFLWSAADGMIDLGTLDDAYPSAAMDISERGEVVGIAYSATTACFIWSKQKGMRPLPTPDGKFCSVARAINDRGQIVGTIVQAPGMSSTSHGFFWSAEDGFTDLGTLPGANISYAMAINNRGEVVGISHSSFVGERPFLWTKATGMIDLGTPEGFSWSGAAGINDNGVIVGWAATVWNFLDARPFVWAGPGMSSELPGYLGAYGQPQNINGCGEVVGSGWSGPRASMSELHPVLWTRGCHESR